MKTLIITMSVEEELAEAAALALNGQTFHVSQRWPALLDQISDFLSDKGYPPGIAADATEVSEYIHQNTVSDNWPSRDSNIFTAVVFADEPISVEKWMDYFQEGSFSDKLSREQAETVFRSVLPAESIRYELLKALLDDYEVYQPEDLMLLPDNTDVPGFDDLSYLLKNCDWNEGNVRQIIDSWSETDLRWLYERNRDTVNRWLSDQQLHLFELSDSLIESGNLCQIITRRWAEATADTFFQLAKAL